MSTCGSQSLRTARDPFKGLEKNSRMIVCVCFVVFSVAALQLIWLTSQRRRGVSFWKSRNSLDVDSHAFQNLLLALERRSSLYSVVNENVVYSRYARVYSRKVRNPNGEVFQYDVWGRNWKNGSFAVVCVVPFDPKTLTFTLIREYNIAHGKYVYSFPQGCYEKSKHSSPLDAALTELEEEARLSCPTSRMTRLLDVDVGSPQDKYQKEVVHYYLCTEISKVSDQNVRSRDAEESIEIVDNISVAILKALVRAGAMQSNNIAAGLLAIDRLRQDGSLPASA